MNSSTERKFITMTVDDLMELLRFIVNDPGQDIENYLAAASMLGSSNFTNVTILDNEESWAAFKRTITKGN